MELKIWIDEGDLEVAEGVSFNEQTVLQEIASEAQEFYARKYGGILEVELADDEGQTVATMGVIDF